MASFRDIRIASDIDQNIFFRDEDITLEMLRQNLPYCSRVPYLRYIKKNKEKTEEYGFLFEKIKRHFKCSERELDFVKEILLEKFEDKEKLREYFVFFGIDKKYYKKFGVELKKKDEGINKWM